MNESGDRWRRLKEVFAEAAELGPENRAKFLVGLRLDDRTLFDELAGLLEVEREASGFLDEPVAVDPGLLSLPMGARIGKYEILGEIGSGGMGVVYEARRSDGEFDQRVAIKLTSRGFFSEELVRRFLTERQILAGLEHPNIVRLIDGGVTDSNVPYYVMEFIEGTPLGKYVSEHRLGIAERLRLFLEVCGAVAYAHRQLVVHRDLKPTNILVTKDGRAKLLDFGIAKILDTENTFTLTQNTPLTPAYASPEQIRGEQVSTSSDVFSLGVILFELLTGQKPAELYGVSALRLPAAICETSPRRPGQIAKEGSAYASLGRRSRGDLDNIILKALRKEPENRYPSVRDLASDIGAYLEGLPVSATPESFGYRAGKFLRRNSLASAAVAVLLILVVAGAGAASWQAVVAKRHQRIAEERFVQVRKVANSLIFEYHDEIAKLEGSTALREKLVSDAVAYLDAIAAGETNDPELLNELGIAYRKIGDVQGRPYEANLGKIDDAAENYQKSIANLERARTIDPKSESFIVELVETKRRISAVETRLGRTENGRVVLEKAIDLLGNSVESFDGRLLRLRLLMAFADTEQYDLVSSGTVYRQALADAMELERSYPENVDLLTIIAKVNQRLSSNLRWIEERKAMNGLEVDAAAFETAVEHGEKIIEYHTKAQLLAGTPRPREMADAYLNLAYNQIEARRFDDAIRNVRIAESYIATVKSSDPRNIEILMDELGAFNARRKIYTRRQSRAEAFGVIEEALQRAISLAERDPKNIEAISWVGHFAKEGRILAGIETERGIRFQRILDEYAKKYRDQVGADWSGYFGF